MSALNSVATDISRHAHRAVEAPITLSQAEAQQDPESRRVLHVLGFGIAGAIFVNGTMFVYFAWLYASG